MLAALFIFLIAFQTGPAPEEVAGEILSDPAYQVELPIGSEADELEEDESSASIPWPSPGGRDNRRRSSGDGGSPRRSTGDLDPADLANQRRVAVAIAELIGWLVAAMALVAVIVWIARILMTFHRDPTLATQLAPAPPGSPTPRLSARPLEEAEALAREGRFAEAIHALLLLSYEELQEQGGLQLRPALTSREILARLPIPEPCRPELRPLVATVETSRFGREQPGRAEFDTCAAHYRRFVEVWEERGE